MPNVDWQTLYSPCAGERVLLDTFQTKFLTQIVNFPTHSQGNILDICLTDRPDWIVEVTDEGHLGSSDHTMIQLTINIDAKPKVSCEKVPN